MNKTLTAAEFLSSPASQLTNRGIRSAIAALGYRVKVLRESAQWCVTLVKVDGSDCKFFRVAGGQTAALRAALQSVRG